MAMTAEFQRALEHMFRVKVGSHRQDRGRVRPWRSVPTYPARRIDELLPHHSHPANTH